MGDGGPPVTTPVVHAVWWTGHPEVAARTFWDQALPIELLARSRHHIIQHDTIGDVPEGEGAVVLVPARFQDGDATALNEALDPLAWVVLIVTSDEEGTFPTEDVTHRNLRMWVQSPRPGRHDPHPRLPLGATTDTRFDHVPPEVPDSRPLHWLFAGQVTHHRRVTAARAVVGRDDGLLLATSRFGSGFDQATYLQVLASARVVLAPSGPVHPDTFRAWETLEAGALPIVDAQAAHYEPSEPWWQWMLGEDPPFPVVDDWDTVNDVVDEALAGWPLNAARAAAWWQATKRRLARRLDDDITALAHQSPHAAGVDDVITVLVTCSPIPSHPATDILDATVASIREQLPTAEILIACDGIPPGLEHRTGDYHRFLHRLTWACRNRWEGVTPLIASEWRHQALTAAWALREVHTPLLLFVEHDTPLQGDIDWDGLVKVVLAGEADVIRFHHEDQVPGEHRHLMLDDEPRRVGGVPLLRTCQWSQRPHLAAADTYRQLLRTYFGPAARTMIEDCLHGVFANAFDLHGEDGWGRVPLWIYAPEGGIRRSGHLDGRDGDPKGEMRFEYDGPTPEGAPRAMSERGAA